MSASSRARSSFLTFPNRGLQFADMGCILLNLEIECMPSSIFIHLITFFPEKSALFLAIPKHEDLSKGGS